MWNAQDRANPLNSWTAKQVWSALAASAILCLMAYITPVLAIVTLFVGIFLAICWQAMTYEFPLGESYGSSNGADSYAKSGTLADSTGKRYTVVSNNDWGRHPVWDDKRSEMNGLSQEELKERIIPGATIKCFSTGCEGMMFAFKVGNSIWWQCAVCKSRVKSQEGEAEEATIEWPRVNESAKVASKEDPACLRCGHPSSKHVNTWCATTGCKCNGFISVFVSMGGSSED